VVHEAAVAWSRWEGATSKLRKDKDVISHYSGDKFAYAFARIENHYFSHGSFYPEDNWILNHAHIIKDIPGVIVHGRYDIICPLISAYELHKAWPKSKLHIIEDAGHSMSEPGITETLLEATEQMGL
jgi:proline iminopeptidase